MRTALWKPQDYAQALLWLRMAADRGDDAAQQAMDWYRKAAAGGSGEAQLSLATMSDAGQSASRDSAPLTDYDRKHAAFSRHQPCHRIVALEALTAYARELIRAGALDTMWME